LTNTYRQNEKREGKPIETNESLEGELKIICAEDCGNAPKRFCSKNLTSPLKKREEPLDFKNLRGSVSFCEVD
jgi:hypothetical protein